MQQVNFGVFAIYPGPSAAQKIYKSQRAGCLKIVEGFRMLIHYVTDLLLVALSRRRKNVSYRRITLLKLRKTFQYLSLRSSFQICFFVRLHKGELVAIFSYIFIYLVSWKLRLQLKISQYESEKYLIGQIESLVHKIGAISRKDSAQNIF